MTRRAAISKPLKRISLRLIGAYVLLTALFFAYGSAYARLWRDPIGRVVGHLCDFVEVERVDVVFARSEHWFELQGVTRVPLEFPEGMIPGGTQMSAATLQGYAVMHVVLIGSLLLAWPCDRWMRRLGLLLAGVPAVAVTTLLDIPFVLAGAASVDARPPGGGTADALVSYYRFIDGGGRPFLALLAAGVVIFSFECSRTVQAGPKERGGHGEMPGNAQ